MLFYSKIKCMKFTGLLPRLDTRHPTTGDIISTRPRIDAEFGHVLGEVEYEDPDTGEKTRGAEIRGHFFDTMAAQELNGWTDEEREAVERGLLRKCETLPEYIKLHSTPPAAAPWPTYDTATNYLEIAKIAEVTGTVAEALAYEKQNKNREGVVKALEEKLAAQQADADLVAA